MPKFRKKPVVIEAVQFVNEEDYEKVCSFVGDRLFHKYMTPPQNLIIPTLEGNMEASPGDWIIKGVNGEFYPCKPDIFEKTYEPVEE